MSRCARCQAAAASYLADHARTQNKRAAQQFADQTKGFSETVKGKAAKAAWAIAMLATFGGHEVLVVKGKKSIDPAVVLLCICSLR